MENYIQLPAPNFEKVPISELPFDWPPPEFITMALGPEDEDLVIKEWHEGDDQLLQMRRKDIHTLGHVAYARYVFVIPFISRTFT